jgi:hypothetical protein
MGIFTMPVRVSHEQPARTIFDAYRLWGSSIRLLVWQMRTKPSAKKGIDSQAISSKTAWRNTEASHGAREIRTSDMLD